MGFSKFINKVRNHSNSGLPSADPAVSDNPTKKQIYQSRYNFGVNFGVNYGGCFVREKWIFHSTFLEGTGCELEAVAKAVSEDKDGAKGKLEEHWNNFVLDDEWKWLQDHGVTGVRVPLGYWNIDGRNFTKDTKFEKYADIYSNSWTIFKQKFVEPAAKHNIGILVDVHGLPGGANGRNHSGETCDGKAEFWGNSSAQKLMESALAFIGLGRIREYYGYPNRERG